MGAAELRLVVGSQDESNEPLSALFLSESVTDLNEGATFLDRLTMEEVTFLRSRGNTLKFKKGEGIFFQGDSHEGIYLIETGRVRTFCTGPNGRELTLAYWTPGHFVGGPEVFGGTHLWSGEAMEDVRLLSISGGVVRDLIERMPVFAVCLIDALVAKGKCYTQLVQMLGTRSVSQRLAQLLLILAQVHGKPDDGGAVVIDRRVTHDQLADIVGSTRQWVSMTLDRWQKDLMIESRNRKIVVVNQASLEDMTLA